MKLCLPSYEDVKKSCLYKPVWDLNPILNLKEQSKNNFRNYFSNYLNLYKSSLLFKALEIKVAIIDGTIRSWRIEIRIVEIFVKTSIYRVLLVKN